MAVDEPGRVGRPGEEMDKDCGGDERDVSTLVSWISVDGICMIMKFWRGSDRIRNLLGCVPRNGISIRGWDILVVPDSFDFFLGDKLGLNWRNFVSKNECWCE